MSGRNCSKLILAIILLGAALAASAQPQPRNAPKAGHTEESYRRARAALDAALKAHTNGAAVNTISVEIRGGLYHRQQSPKATGDPVATPFQASLIADFTRKWTIWERTGSFPGGIEFSNRWILKGASGRNVDLLRKTVAPQPNPESFAEANLRRFPATLLAQAAGRAATLRWLGESEADGQKLAAISYATASGTTFSLFFDASSHLLMRWENMQSDPLRGDVLSETIIKGTTNPRKFPCRRGK